MGIATISTRNGIVVSFEGATYAFDPKKPVKTDYTFVSHAHLDHVALPESNTKVLTSRETRLLAEARGFNLGHAVETAESVDLLDSGHILGARAICIEDELLYTGDAAGRDRGFLNKCKTRRARALITETTFGKTGYVFPPMSEIVKAVNETIGTLYDKGKPVVLMGYALGKSQILSYLFSSWSPLFVHESVSRLNRVYRDCGIALHEGAEVSADLEGLCQGPWLMITPMMSSRSRLMQRLKKDYGAVSIAFSGWAVDPGYKYSLGVDYAFPVSDHCDYNELMSLVDSVAPEVVYTTHGFTQEFASDLRRKGYDARPLSEYQASLAEY